ncbi:MAG: putative glycoside hydrolase [Anaerolineae bacterium]
MRLPYFALLLMVLVVGCSSPSTPAPSTETVPPPPPPTVKTSAAPTATPTLVIQGPRAPTAQGAPQAVRRLPVLVPDGIGIWGDIANLNSNLNPTVANQTAQRVQLVSGAAALSVRQANTQALALLTIDASKPDQVASATQTGLGAYDGILLDQAGIPARADSLSSTTKLLAALRPVAGVRIILASTYAWSDGAGYAQYTADAKSLLSQVDGICICDFLRKKETAPDSFKSVIEWKKDVDALDQLSRNANTIVLVATRVAPPQPPPGWDPTQWFKYSLASYLLGVNGPRTYYSYQGLGASGLILDDDLTVKLGASYGPYYSAYNMYVRQFAKGLVVVNPGTSVAEMPLAQPYVASNGQQVTSVRLDPQTGAILRRLP